jgi:hypothetical protein
MSSMPSSPENSRRVVTAATTEGYAFPVIDVTNPAFALDDSPKAIDALRRGSIEYGRRYSRLLPNLLMRLLVRVLARNSLLLRALTQPDAAYLGGLSTYVMKLGPDNLVAPFNERVDRKVAASPQVTSVRVRLQQTARLLAQGLEEDLAGRAGVALHLINIGGGSAIDALNALILLKRSAPMLLARPVTIHVLDLDPRAPQFGANALAALQAPVGPLAGLDIRLVYRRYAWDETAPLARLLGEVASDGAALAASSEGALFEYGTDAAIVDNLRVLRTHGVGTVAGSVTRADELALTTLADSRFKLRPRGIEVFSRLAAQAGFAVARVEQSVMSDQVLLRAA